jgi:O-phosphoseryl-tRNA(Cys) synthetase
MMAKERSLKEDDLNEEAGLTEMDYYDEIKFHLNQYNAGKIDGDDLANAIEEIVLDAKVDAI